MTRILFPAAFVLCAAMALAATADAAGSDAKGTLVYKARTATMKYAYLVKGPDAVSKQPLRRLILSATDLGGKIASCMTMSCTDGYLGEGLSVNLEPGPRFNYWVSMNDQRVQYSGTEPIASLTATTDDARRLAGVLRFDKTAAGGPKVDITFDAALVKEVSAP